MRNRFKPTLSTSRGSRRTGAPPNENAGENVSSSGSSANSKVQETTPRTNEVGESSETVTEAMATTEQGQGRTAQPKTPTSSTSAAGSSRRSRIKPAVIPVARARPKNGNKDKTTTGTQHASADRKETKLSVSQGRKTYHNNDKQLSSNEEERQEADSSTEEVSKSPSLKERNKQTKSGCSAVPSPSATNTELRSQPVAQEPVIKPSQSQNKNTNYDNTVMQTNDIGTPPALLRRKRVLPNLGSASRRRHSSVSKENVEKITDIPEVRHEEVVTTGKDLVHIDEQSPVECSASRKKRLHSLSEEENTTDHGIPPAAPLDTHDKEDVEEDEEDNKKKGVKRKRGGKPHKLKEPSDPSQMTMQHLIYFNPKTNPMASSMAGKKKKPDRKSKRKKGNDKNSQDKETTEDTDAVNNPLSVSGSPTRTDPPQNNNEINIDEGDTNSNAVAPRVKLDADGNIIVDEESLLIPKTPEKNLHDREIVYEDADEVNVGAYLKHRKVERWSLEETQKFYMALSQVGTDFSLMGPLFPSRIRRELKAKFKREEKQHRGLVEKALRVRNPIDVELFTPKVDGEEIDDDLTTSTQPT